MYKTATFIVNVKWSKVIVSHYYVVIIIIIIIIIIIVHICYLLCLIYTSLHRPHYHAVRHLCSFCFAAYTYYNSYGFEFVSVHEDRVSYAYDVEVQTEIVKLTFRHK